jgi:hypothetical protein
MVNEPVPLFRSRLHLMRATLWQLSKRVQLV